jgi:hypothetical protein
VTAAEPVDLVIEYSLDGGLTWQHGKTVPAWVGDDPGQLRLQRAAVREQALADHGEVGAVVTRVLREDDPRGVLNQPPAAASPPLLTAFSPAGELVTLDELLGEPVMQVTMRGGPETVMAVFLAMELDLTAELTDQGIVPVSVVHGDMDPDNAAAIEQLTALAEECGHHSMRGGSDYMTFLFRGDDAHAAALRFTGRVDAIARPGWRITPTFAPERPR